MQISKEQKNPVFCTGEHKWFSPGTGQGSGLCQWATIFCHSLTHLHGLVLKCIWPFLYQFPLQCPIQDHWPWWRNQEGTWVSPGQEIYGAFAHLMQKANQKLTSACVFPVMCWPSTGAQAGMLVSCCASPSKRAVIILKSIQNKVWATDEFCTLGRSSCLSEKKKKNCLGGFQVMLFLFPELPAGWEKIEDPVYGVYYVE